MSDKRSNPPRLAIWFLQHACPGDNEALTGDLIERFGEGKTHAWFWRQVLVTFVIAVAAEIRAHWPHLCYAVAGTVMPPLLEQAVPRAPLGMQWWAFPWTWSMFVFEICRPVLLTWAALPVLAATLVVKREFRWVCLLRTGVINMAFVILALYLPDAFPWLLRPVPGNSYLNVLIVPPVMRTLLFFSTFFMSAWLGCRSPRESGELLRGRA